MDPDLTKLLRCPRTGKPLLLKIESEHHGRVQSGMLCTEDEVYEYPVRNFIPRFVSSDNYADNFGMQWNSFRLTQLDSHTGHPISANRFWNATKWKPEELSGEWVLDIGCGAGRFAEVALQANAKVVAIDYSEAVDACYANLQHYPNLHVIQADICHMPLPLGFFPYIYCLGVLQHTPDVARAFASLPPMLSVRGILVVDVYEKSLLRMLLSPKYWLRPLTRRLPKHVLFRTLQKCVPPLFIFSRAAQRIPLIGSGLRRCVPVANNTSSYTLSPKHHLEWALLDTFDWYSPEYDQPQTADTLRAWLRAAGLAEVEVEKVGHLVGRGKRNHKTQDNG